MGEADCGAGREIFHLVLKVDGSEVGCEDCTLEGLSVTYAVFGGGGAMFWALLLVHWYLLTSDLEEVYSKLIHRAGTCDHSILYSTVRAFQEGSPGQPAARPSLDNVDWRAVCKGTVDCQQ